MANLGMARESAKTDTKTARRASNENTPTTKAPHNLIFTRLPYPPSSLPHCGIDPDQRAPPQLKHLITSSSLAFPTTLLP